MFKAFTYISHNNSLSAHAKINRSTPIEFLRRIIVVKSVVVSASIQLTPVNCIPLPFAIKLQNRAIKNYIISYYRQFRPRQYIQKTFQDAGRQQER